MWSRQLQKCSTFHDRWSVLHLHHASCSLTGGELDDGLCSPVVLRPVWWRLTYPQRSVSHWRADGVKFLVVDDVNLCCLVHRGPCLEHRVWCFFGVLFQYLPSRTAGRWSMSRFVRGRLAVFPITSKSNHCTEPNFMLWVHKLVRRNTVVDQVDQDSLDCCRTVLWSTPLCWIFLHNGPHCIVDWLQIRTAVSDGG